MNLFKVSNLCDGVRGGTFLSFCAKADDATIERITDLKLGFRVNKMGSRMDNFYMGLKCGPIIAYNL